MENGILLSSAPHLSVGKVYLADMYKDKKLQLSQHKELKAFCREQLPLQLQVSNGASGNCLSVSCDWLKWTKTADSFALTNEYKIAICVY